MQERMRLSNWHKEVNRKGGLMAGGLEKKCVTNVRIT